jgi:protein-arginine kinase activator protein McsA
MDKIWGEHHVIMCEKCGQRTAQVSFDVANGDLLIKSFVCNPCFLILAREKFIDCKIISCKPKQLMLPIEKGWNYGANHTK